MSVKGILLYGWNGYGTGFGLRYWLQNILWCDAGAAGHSVSIGRKVYAIGQLQLHIGGRVGGRNELRRVLGGLAQRALQACAQCADFS